MNVVVVSVFVRAQLCLNDNGPTFNVDMCVIMTRYAENEPSRADVIRYASDLFIETHKVNAEKIWLPLGNFTIQENEINTS